MARADLLTALVKYGMISDKARFQKVVETIIAEERAKKHTVLADQLEEFLRNSQPETPKTNSNSFIDYKVSNLLHEVTPEISLDDLVLPKAVKDITREFVQEHHRADLLRSYNLEPRNRVLLIGPPGNGKTSLAEAIARALIVPLLIIRYEGVVGTYLGETSVRLRRLVEYASTRRCVLFFDEFETLGKERGDRHETGEIKRVVSSLLMQIDSLPSHVVVIGATNHAELLDRAVWRRFQVRMKLPKPTRVRLAEWFSLFEIRNDLDLGYAPETLAKKLYGSSFAEVEEFGTSVMRQHVLNLPDSDIRSVVNRTLKNWSARSVKEKQQNGEEDNA